MAKKTQAVLREEAAAERAAQFEKVKAEYPQRLMSVMAEYSQIHRYTFSKNTHVPLSFVFNVFGNDGYERFNIVLQAELTSFDNLYDLESVERTVEEHYESELESQRRYEVLKEAQRKIATLLNDEERQLLGIIT